MGVAKQGTLAGGLILFCAAPLRAECLGSGCYDGLAALLFGALGYGALGLVILILLIRAKWRAAGWKVLAAVVVLAIGVPLVTQGWQAWKLFRLEGREIVGQPPTMTGRTPLLIALDRDCYYDACAAVLWGRGKAGVYVVTEEALQGLDLTQPIRLADLPLEFWATGPQQDATHRMRRLTPAERQRAATRIDYMVLVTQSYGRAEPGAIEAALHANPVLANLREGDVVHLAMAPLDPAQGAISFADLRFDVLDLSLSGRTLALPLAPYNWQNAANSAVGVEVVAQALCPTPDGLGELFCRERLE